MRSLSTETEGNDDEWEKLLSMKVATNSGQA